AASRSTASASSTRGRATARSWTSTTARRCVRVPRSGTTSTTGLPSTSSAGTSSRARGRRFSRAARSRGAPSEPTRPCSAWAWPGSCSEHTRMHQWLTMWLAGVGDAALFAARALREAVRPPYEVRETLRQLYELGCRSVPLIAVSGFAVGVVLSMHTRSSLARFGAEGLIPAGLAIALVRETGPLVAGLLLAGRIGAGIGAELGAM